MAPPALIIVDMQKDFVLPGTQLYVEGALETVPVIRSLLDWFRMKSFPVFHVYREHLPDGSDVEKGRQNDFLSGRSYAVAGSTGCEIVDELKPASGEYPIVKKRFSAFMNTELDLILRRKGIEDLVVCGTQYPNCIRATVFDGIALGYDATLITDATSAASAEIAAANIIDIENIGVPCITAGRYMQAHGEKVMPGNA